MNQSQPKGKHGLKIETVSLGKALIWLALILASLVGVLFWAYRLKLQTSPLEYEGRVIDKWAGYSHSEHGSIPYFKILLETDEGQRLIVSVNDDTYQRAKVGMWIKKSAKGVELSAFNIAATSEYSCQLRHREHNNQLIMDGLVSPAGLVLDRLLQTDVISNYELS